MTSLQQTIGEPSFAADVFRRIAGRGLYGLEASGSAVTAGRHAPSDFDLNPTVPAAEVLTRPGTPAAVLVPVVARSELTVLLTQRTEHLASHAGQIAFPGGKIDAADGGPVAAALREAFEETGLDPALVEPLGTLDRYRTVTGFSITPVVAIVSPDFSLSLNRNEVADAFEVPLSFLMDGRNHAVHTRLFRGEERRYYAMPFGERYIWGATAGILKNMHTRLFTP